MAVGACPAITSAMQSIPCCRSVNCTTNRVGDCFRRYLCVCCSGGNINQKHDGGTTNMNVNTTDAADAPPQDPDPNPVGCWQSTMATVRSVVGSLCSGGTGAACNWTSNSIGSCCDTSMGICCSKKINMNQQSYDGQQTITANPHGTGGTPTAVGVINASRGMDPMQPERPFVPEDPVISEQPGSVLHFDSTEKPKVSAV